MLLNDTRSAHERNAEGLEIWGGIECTINRVRGQFYNQCKRSGHDARITDLDRIASLGIKTLRYPVLWEQVAPISLDEFDWETSDRQLQRLRELGIEPIAGLVHHGSGPAYTDLLDDEFPEKLAAYARAVAERYPWLRKFTPVNEPLTTARFSCLYGIWYPHLRDDVAFSKALLNEIKGTVLAMRAIREVIPDAELVQTDDLGKTHATSKLQYQAEMENERRWLTWDLLTGSLAPDMPMWRRFVDLGISEEQLQWFRENPCAPNYIGANYYVTSERFIDHRTGRYPEPTRGGNGRDSYADVEAVRVLADGISGPAALLMEAWVRYRLPLAVTECHLGCTREEQVRWLRYVHEGALRAKAQGADVRALTVWSLFGAYDWNTLLCEERGHYESGVFDLRACEPRETALADAIRALTENKPMSSLFELPGWWERPIRLEHPPVLLRTVDPAPAAPAPANPVRPLLITGASGTLGQAFGRICELRGVPYRLVSRHEMDMADPQSVRNAVVEYGPWAIVNAAGYVRVDDAEEQILECFRDNTAGARNLARICAEAEIPLLSFSSDLVFDGKKEAPYVESDEPAPLSVYGCSKHEMERKVLEVLPQALVIRTSAFFGPWDEHNFLHHVVSSVEEERMFAAADDLTVTPTYVPHLVNRSLDLLIDGERGIWHLTNPEPVTWYELAVKALRHLDLSTRHVEAVSHQKFGCAAPRPTYSALASERGWIMPSLDEALAAWAEERSGSETRAPQMAYFA